MEVFLELLLLCGALRPGLHFSNEVLLASTFTLGRTRSLIMISFIPWRNIFLLQKNDHRSCDVSAVVARVLTRPPCLTFVTASDSSSLHNFYGQLSFALLLWPASEIPFHIVHVHTGILGTCSTRYLTFRFPHYCFLMSAFWQLIIILIAKNVTLTVQKNPFNFY